MTSKQKLLIANVAVLIVAALAVWMLFRSRSAESPSGTRPAPPHAPTAPEGERVRPAMPAP